MRTQEKIMSFLFDNLRIDVIDYLEEYISRKKTTLDKLKARFRRTLSEEILEQIENVEALVDALEKNGVIGDQNVEMLKKLARMIRLPELAERVEEYEADCAGISRRILKAAGKALGFLWDVTKGAILHVKVELPVRGVLSSAAVLYIWHTNPELLQNLEPLVDLGIKVKNLLKGSVVFVLSFRSISSLKQLWRSYKDGSLKEKLKKAFNKMGEMKKLSQGEEIDVEVTIDEEEYREVRLDLILMEMKERNPVVTSWAPPKKENVNFARLSKLLIDGGTLVLRDVFDLIHSPSTLHATLLSAPVYSTLKGLRGKRVLNTQQWNKLYPASKSTPVTSASFDITLLFVLLRNICGLTPPPTGWDKPPVATELSREADLVRVKYYRNELYVHATETAVSDSEFEKYWKEISEVLVRLGGPQHDEQIKMLKIRSMDVEEEKYFTEILEDWEQAERSLKTMVEGQARLQETMEKQAGLQQTMVEGQARLQENFKNS